MEKRALGMCAAVCGLSLLGCFQHTHHIGSGSATGTVVYEQWRHHWIAGLISPDHEMQLQEVCPGGNATIHQEQTFLNGLVGVLTGGIYVPMTVEVRCETGRRAQLDFDREDVAGILSDPTLLEWVEARLPEKVAEVRGALAAQAQN